MRGRGLNGQRPQERTDMGWKPWITSFRAREAWLGSATVAERGVDYATAVGEFATGPTG